MNIHQLTAADIDALRELANIASGSASTALSSMIRRSIDLAPPLLSIETLGDTMRRLDEVHSQETVVYVEVDGEIAGHAVLLLPGATRRALLAMLRVKDEDAWIRDSAMMEIGNIMVSTYVRALIEMTGLNGEPTPPVIGRADASMLLETPIARAAGDSDAVVSFDAPLALDEGFLAEAAFHLMYFPAPGTLQRILGTLDLTDSDAELRIPVRMGELAVSKRRGDVLVANGLGSCVAIAIVDPRLSLAAVAHVMLPDAPERRTLGGRPTYAPRYADTAVPALLDALERAGGSRARARAYIAGGGSMFHGSVSDAMRIGERNTQAVRASLEAHGVKLEADETGGPVGRSLTVRVNPLDISCKVLETRTATRRMAS